jgi:hypothetical protein
MDRIERYKEYQKEVDKAYREFQEIERELKRKWGL